MTMRKIFSDISGFIDKLYSLCTHTKRSITFNDRSLWNAKRYAIP